MHPLTKIKPKIDPTLIYEGQIADRVTEDDYETKNIMEYDQKFSDRVRVFVKGGRGGSGCLAFSRENYQSRRPDGGSGGKGGDVYFKATEKLMSLYDLRRAHFVGNHGGYGKG